MKPVIIFADAAVSQPAIAAGQPGDGAFDHGPMLAILGQPVGVARGSAGGAQERIVRADPQGFCRCGREVHRSRTGQFDARHTEGHKSGAADRSGQPVGAGCGAGSVIDGEIIHWVNPPAIALRQPVRG